MKNILLGLLFLFSAISVMAQTEEVQFKNAKGDLSFGATISSPKAGNNSGNAVILISGTGKQDRDGNMAGHAWFKVLATYLNEKGLTVLRMDDRGVGKTTGSYEDATTEDFAADALSAVSYLKSRKDLKIKKIGLLGHSEGGIAIAIAASKSKDIAFLISLSGLATSGLNAQLDQNKDIVAAAPIPDHDKKRYDEINALMFNTALKYADSTNMHAKLNEVYDAWKVKDEEHVKALGIKFDHFRFPIYSWSLSAERPWYRFLIKYNPEDYLPRLKVPILAINGEKDMMVRAESNLNSWRNLTLKGGNKNVTTRLFPGLNHLLQHCITCQPQEYATIKETIAPEVLEEIGKWLFNNRLSK